MGHFGKGDALMPAKGRVFERDYTAKERDAIVAGATARGLARERAFDLLGVRTLDVYLNNIAYWTMSRVAFGNIRSGATR